MWAAELTGHGVDVVEYQFGTSRDRRQKNGGSTMPQRSKVDLLPDQIREDLEHHLIQGGFSGYRELSLWLGEQGFEISKSSRETGQILRNVGALSALPPRHGPSLRKARMTMAQSMTR